MPKTLDNLTVDDSVNVKRVYGNSGYIQFNNTDPVNDASLIFPTVGATNPAIPDTLKETRFIRGLPMPIHPFQYFFQANTSISCSVPFSYPSGNVEAGAYSALIYFIGARLDQAITITGTIKSTTSALTAYPPFLVLKYMKEVWGSGDINNTAMLWDPIAHKSIVTTSLIGTSPTMVFTAPCMILSNKS